MSTVVYVTAKGKKMLEDQLAELISQRGDAAAAISEARSFGDLKENAEYVAARDNQAELESRIDVIKDRLQNIKTFAYVKADTTKVSIGTCVEIQATTGSKSTQKWIITGIVESDPANNYISNESPLAKALLGKKVGEIAEIHVPTGSSKYKIVKITVGA
ncbi:MAG: transcription elongation factor GreA [Firmicutes bacterium]|nr:transcription elongation factor GreA [Bacillota bacterium]